MKFHGFVAQVEYAARGPVQQVTSAEAAGGRLVWTPGIEVFVRARPSTPEAYRESQPIVRDSLVLAYVGRVDNRRELAGSLNDSRLASAPDGEVLAAAFSAWGASLSAHAIGEYAYVAIDRCSARLTAGHDALGVRKLYFHDDGRALTVASELAFLLHLVEREPRIDEHALAGFFIDAGMVRSGHTIYRAIRELPACQVLTQSARASTTRPCWRPDAGREIRFRDAKEYDEALLELVEAGVEASLRTPGALIADVSGGLDSSTVACVAGRLGKSRGIDLTAYSHVASRTPTFDQRCLQAAVTATCDIPSATVDLDEALECALIDEEHFVQPSRGLFGGALKRALGELAAATGATGWLNGHGGDAVFWGPGLPPFFLGGDLRRLRLRAWLTSVNAFAASDRWSLSQLVRWSTARRYRPEPKLGTAPEWLGNPLRNTVIDVMAAGSGSDLFRCPGRALQFDFLTRAVRADVGRGRPSWVEPRSPLLYRPLVEFMLAVPWDQKQTPGQTRVLQRRALRGTVPDVVLDRRSKADFSPFFVRGLATHWGPMQRFVRGSMLAARGLVDQAEFEQACRRLRHGTSGPFDHFVRAGLALEAWLQLGGPSRVDAGLPREFLTPTGDRASLLSR